MVHSAIKSKQQSEGPPRTFPGVAVRRKPPVLRVGRSHCLGVNNLWGFSDSGAVELVAWGGIRGGHMQAVLPAGDDGD